MQIEGRVEGSIALHGQKITVGRTGQTDALLTANEIVVLGQVRGNCQASDHLDIRSEGSMSGNAIVSRQYPSQMEPSSKETSTFVAPEFGDATGGSNCPIILLKPQR
jgi:hypothetical protein